jgi:hypothetical protein
LQPAYRRRTLPAREIPPRYKLYLPGPMVTIARFITIISTS